uniref:Uncharacterized protein n=1 Tax=Rhizophora mucronata TaxID=61149 RepID=A0A2P2N5L7_RHIMU
MENATLFRFMLNLRNVQVDNL